MVASVESLLTAIAMDRMHSGRRVQIDRELCGQGAANTASGALGGLPVAGAIVRSTGEALCRLIQENVREQLDHLMGYPVVAERVESGELTLTGTYYGLETARAHLLDAGTSMFMPGTSAQDLPLQRARTEGQDTGAVSSWRTRRRGRRRGRPAEHPRPGTSRAG